MAIYSIFSSFGLPVKTRPIMDVDDDSDCSPEEHYVGKHYSALELSYWGYIDDGPSYGEYVSEVWPCDKVDGIVWMNTPKHQEVALVSPAVSSTTNSPAVPY